VSIVSQENSDLFVPAPCICCESNGLSVRFPIDLEHASTVSQIDIRDRQIGVAVCDRCGHEFIQPVPSSAFLQAYYSNYMSQAKSGFYQERASETIPERFRARYTPWLDILGAMLNGRRRLLDIGAGLGMFLRLAREHAFEVQGVEPNSEAADVLRERYGIKVINNLFEQVEITGGGWDAISMWDLLEHLADPRSALRKAAALLVPQGVLVLEIPARDSLLHSLAKKLYGVSGGRFCRPLYLVCGLHHLHYFSEQDIFRLLREEGFDVREIHRGETELESLYRGKSGSRGFAAMTFNVALVSVFLLARALKRQNKLIIFAQKI